MELEKLRQQVWKSFLTPDGYVFELRNAIWSFIFKAKRWRSHELEKKSWLKSK